MAEEKKLPLQFRKVVNPTTEDLHFLYDSAQYVLKAGETQDKWSEHHAKHAAKKLADKNIMTNNPEEHRVLMGAYLSNQEVEVVAKSLGINLGKIRKEAITKEQAKSRVINLEAQMLEMKAEMKEMKGLSKEKKVVKKEEVKEVVSKKAPKKRGRKKK